MRWGGRAPPEGLGRLECLLHGNGTLRRETPPATAGPTTSALSYGGRKFTSSTENRAAPLAAATAARVLLLRCASVPKTTASASAAAAAMPSAGTWSHAAGVANVYVASPLLSISAVTKPVSASAVRTRETSTPLPLKRRSTSRPSRSSPTADAKLAWAPSSARWHATLSGAPPRKMPEGRASKRHSPTQSTRGGSAEHNAGRARAGVVVVRGAGTIQAAASAFSGSMVGASTAAPDFDTLDAKRRPRASRATPLGGMGGWRCSSQLHKNLISQSARASRAACPRRPALAGSNRGCGPNRASGRSVAVLGN